MIMWKYIRKVMKKFAALALAILAAVAIFVPAVSRVAKADERAFDSTSVLEDLSDIDLSQYPAGTGEDLQLIRFMEYGFMGNSSENYGLYVYVYNPEKIELSTREGSNTVNIATAYVGGKPSEYANVDLKLCDYSTGVYSKLFYKFRIVGDEIDKIYANAKASELSLAKRRYDVAGLQFWEKGASEANIKGNTASGELGAVKDYSVSRTFYFSGYAKGCGAGAEEASTLACSYDELATVELELQHTNWRNSTTYKDYTYEEVNSVYFSVPNEIFETYGSLQAIKAEWYEYKTSPMFITSDEAAYNELLDWIAVNVGEYTEANPWRVFWEEFVLPSTDLKLYTYYALYNQKRGTENTDSGWEAVEDVLGTFSFSENAKTVPSMDWLFYRESPKTLADYEVTRAEVEEWAKEYSSDNKSQGKVDARKTFYAEGLFADSIDSDRLSFLDDQSKKRGYTVQEISATEKVNLLEYKSQSWWEKFTGKKKTTTTALSYTPIRIVKESDLKGTASYISDNLLVNERDVDGADGENNTLSFREYCQEALDSGETPVLFHFANTDYYASKARFDKRGNGEISKVDGYVCQQTVFLDFDVISLTFEKNGTETVLGCVADPIDIFNGATPPTDLVIGSGGCSCAGDWKKTFSIVLIAIVVVIVWRIYRKIRDRITLRRARKEQKKKKRKK